MKKLKVLNCTALLVFVALSKVAWGDCSPIIIDLNNNGIDLGDAGVGVYFDVNADGALDYVQWVRPGGDEVFLSLDRNGNGIVDDGSELFGVGTPMIIDGGSAENGFVGLAQYDMVELGGNDDGLITAQDAIWSELRVWDDANADGVSVPSEVLSLDEVSPPLTSFETIPKFRKYYDKAGNAIPYWAWATINASGGNGRRSRTLMVDVYFKQL